jgi:hypothetical protein
MLWITDLWEGTVHPSVHLELWEVVQMVVVIDEGGGEKRLRYVLIKISLTQYQLSVSSYLSIKKRSRIRPIQF